MLKLRVKDIRKEQVIKAAKQCIVRKGLINLSMRDIAREAEVSTGVIYHYFENKEDILLQVLKESFRQSHAQVVQSVDPIQTSEKKLEKHLQNINAVPRDNPEFYTVLLNYLGEAKYNLQIHNIVTKFFSNLKGYIENYMDDEVGRDGDKNLPIMVYALGLGLGIMWTTDSNLFDIDEMEESIKTLILGSLNTDHR